MTGRVRYVLPYAFIGVLLVGLLIGGVVPSEARPPPRPVCEPCGVGFVEAADRHDVPVSVEQSTADVRVHRNGSATWTVTNRIDASAAERLRTNDSLLSAIAEEAVGRDLRSTDISTDGAVTIRYHTDGFTVDSIGSVQRSDQFTVYENRDYDILGADRLTLVAPDGMRIGMAVPGASVDGRLMIITSYDVPPDGSFVTFVPTGTGGIKATTLSWLSVATVLAPVYIPNFIVHVGLPAAVFVLAIRLIAVVLAQFDREFAPLSLVLFSLIGAVGLLVVVGGVADAMTSGLDSEAAASVVLFETGIGAGAFGVALSIRSVRDRLTYPKLTAGAVLAALITGVVAGLLGGSMINRTIFSVALFALVPAGYELGRGHRRRGYATAVIGYIALLAHVVPLGTRLFDPLLILYPTLGGLAALTFAAMGAPLLAVGLTLSAQIE